MDLYHRLVTVASRYWGIPPDEVAARGESGALLLSDVLALVRLLAHDPISGPGIVQFVFPEQVKRAVKAKVDGDTARANARSIAQIALMTPAKSEKEKQFLEAVVASARKSGG